MGFVQDGGHSIEDGSEALLDAGDDGEGGGIGHFVFGILNLVTGLEFGGTVMMERVEWAQDAFELFGGGMMCRCVSELHVEDRWRTMTYIH